MAKNRCYQIRYPHSREMNIFYKYRQRRRVHHVVRQFSHSRNQHYAFQCSLRLPPCIFTTRLPRKPLLEIAGRPMVWHVWNRAVQAEGLTAVYVTTPDAEIAEAVEQFGGKTVLTSHDCRTGSDRLAEAARLLGLQQDDIVVNMQGDEPMLDPAAISAVIQPLLKESSVVMSSVERKLG